MAHLSEDLINRFNASPLCNASLASKELFHSNFLAWLLKISPQFAKLFLRNPDAIVSEVLREKKHIDLTIKTNIGTYLVENKVKSLPDECQLAEYKRENIHTNSRFIYLSLATPSEATEKNHADVYWTSYNDIYSWINNRTDLECYPKLAVQDYQILLETLFKVNELATIKTLNSKLGFEKSEGDKFEQLRLHDVAQKLRHHNFIKVCRDQLNGNKDAEILNPVYEAGLSRSNGLVSIKFTLTCNTLIGIQIQAGQYRRFIESTNNADVENMALNLVKQGWLKGDNKAEKLCKFGKIFRYRYDSISSSTINDIVSKIAADMSYINKEMPAIKAAIK
jgi:PD-(D/E)XK nuclease superfamily